VIAIAEKKQVKRCDCNKPVKKSSMSWHCQIVTRLVFAWYGCNLVKIQMIATSFTCGCNHWCVAIAKKTVARPENIGDCNLVAVCTLISVWLWLQ
jgi:hypothetical protein